MNAQIALGIVYGVISTIAVLYVLVTIGKRKSKAKYVKAQAALQQEFQAALIKAYRRGVTDMTAAITKKVDCSPAAPSEEERRN